MIVTIGDFTGKYELHTGIYDQSKIQAYIDKYEPRYLRELLGATLYSEFLTDLVLVQGAYTPQSPNFLTLFNPFAVDVNLYRMLESDGIREMLLGFIYFEYIKDTSNTITPFGNTVSRSELSKLATSLQSLMYNRYNEAVRTFMAIREYVVLNWNDFNLGQLVAMTMLYNSTNYVSGAGQYLYVANGWVTQLSQDTLGSGYTQGDILTLGLNGLQVEVTQVDGIGAIQDFIITQQGYGHTVGQILNASGGTGGGGQTFQVDAIANSNGSFTGDAYVTLDATPIGGVNLMSILQAGTSYQDDADVPLIGGNGTGATCEIQASPVNGVLTAVTQWDNGTGYQVGDTMNVDQNGNVSGLIVVDSIYNGEINSATLEPNAIANSKGFQVGDRIRIGGNASAPNGNGATYDAIYEVTYVGIGDISTYNGKEKLYNYWI